MDNYYRSKEFKEILSQYENLQGDNASLNNDSSLLGTDDYSNIAQYYHEKGDDQKALDAINTALRIFPGSVAPLSFLSRYALLEENNIKKAQDIAESIDDKHDPDYILLSAEIMIVDGKVAEADEYLDEAYAMFADDEYYDDMPLDVAMLFSDYEEMDYAEKWLERSDEDDEIDYKVVKAKILMINGEFKKSEDIINKLINDNPYSNALWDLLSAAQTMNNEISEAATSCDYALAIDPDDRDALINKANAMELLENYSEAEKLYRHYIKLEPKKITGYISLAFLLINQERMQEALVYLDKALEILYKSKKNTWQTKVDILFQMAYIENYLEHFAKAHKNLDRIADVFKDNLGNDLDELGMQLADVDCAQGHICLEEEKIDEALDWFEQAANDSGGSPRIYVKIAESAYESGYVQYAYNILHELIYNQGIEDILGLKCLAACCKHFNKTDEQKWAEDKIANYKHKSQGTNNNRKIN